MDRLIDYTILVFFVIYITYVLKFTDGPFDVFWRIRQFAGYTYDVVELEEIVGDTSLARLIDCWWCLTLWISIIGCVVYFLLTMNLFDLLILPFGVAGLSSIFYKFLLSEEE